MIRTYSELLLIDNFIDRYRYLKLDGKVAEETFGFDRYINQKFYKSKEWRRVRDSIIARDMGCDLGHIDNEILGRIIVHHINPISKEDILNYDMSILNPEYLICTSKRTHDAIHYGDENLLFDDIIERSKNDTCPWRR